MLLLWLLSLHCLFAAKGLPQRDSEAQKVWLDIGQKELEEALEVRQNSGVAKNVILFVGDGMGISTVTAARIYKGQTEQKMGEETLLNFEKFPFVALAKTYSADRQTSASASTCTALMAGVKANFGTVGFDHRVTRGNCSLVNDSTVHVTTMLDWSYMAGKSVGVVTNTRITHATPAATYAHSPDRNWERDSDIASLPESQRCVPDIATQLLEENSNLTVIMGGGRRAFKSRSDGKDLVEEWKATKQREGKSTSYVENLSQLNAVDVENTDHLLGLFTESHMAYELHRDRASEPSLAEMTAKAIQVLKKNEKGFFLFVEGGRIDHGHHDNWAKRALAETVAMDEAVAAALDMTDNKDTLIVVTADHSHPFNIVGYPTRGNGILDKVDIVDPGQETLDGKPYTTLVYANGPGPNRTQDLTDVDTTTDDFQYQILVPFQSGWETHSGEDVGIYATGPMAHLFHGVHEQNYVAHVMAYASCVGRNKKHCDSNSRPNNDGCTGGAGRLAGKFGGAVAWMALLVCAIVSVHFI